jgi:hypothetical protein
MRKEQWVRVCGKGTRKLRGENEVANWLKAKGEEWRRGWESNPRIKVLQTSPLPLGYRASALQYSETVPDFQPGRFGRGRKTALLIFNCEQQLQSPNGRTEVRRYKFKAAAPSQSWPLQIQRQFANEEIGVLRRMPLPSAPLADVQLVWHAGLHRLHPADDVLQHGFEGLRFAHVVVFLAFEKLLEK